MPCHGKKRNWGRRLLGKIISNVAPFHRPEQKQNIYRSIFQFYLWSVCKTRLRLLFPFSNHKKDHFPFPTMNILWEREVFEQNSVLFLVKKPQIIHEYLNNRNEQYTVCTFFACAGQSSFIPSHCSLSFFRLVLLRQFKKSTSRAGLLHTRSELLATRLARQWQRPSGSSATATTFAKSREKDTEF